MGIHGKISGASVATRLLQSTTMLINNKANDPRIFLLLMYNQKKNIFHQRKRTHN